jgi:hypothetical protein
MKYMVDTVKARQIHRIACYAEKTTWICSCVFPISALVAIVSGNHIVGNIACVLTVLGSIIFIASVPLYAYTVCHVATQYIEFIDRVHPKILGMCLRDVPGGNANADIREAYFLYSDSHGDTQEYFLGTVTKAKKRISYAPIVDITRQIYFL